MLDRKPLSLTPEELNKWRQVANPYIEKLRELEQERASVKTTFDAILVAFLVGRNLEGAWNIDFNSGLIQPLPLLNTTGAHDPVPPTQRLPLEGEDDVPHQ